MKNFKTHNNFISIDIGGTSLVGRINTTYDKLVEIFGIPLDGDGHKSDSEWEIQFSDGNVATIYNYKNGINYNGSDGTPVEEITDWHIGGYDIVVVEMVKNELK